MGIMRRVEERAQRRMARLAITGTTGQAVLAVLRVKLASRRSVSFYLLALWLVNVAGRLCMSRQDSETCTMGFGAERFSEFAT